MLHQSLCLHNKLPLHFQYSSESWKVSCTPKSVLFSNRISCTNKNTTSYWKLLMFDSFLSFLQCLHIVLAFAVDGKISPPLTGDFRPSQLLESTVQIRSDINPRYGRFLRLSVSRRFLREEPHGWKEHLPYTWLLHSVSAYTYRNLQQWVSTQNTSNKLWKFKARSWQECQWSLMPR